MKNFCFCFTGAKSQKKKGKPPPADVYQKAPILVCLFIIRIQSSLFFYPKGKYSPGRRAWEILFSQSVLYRLYPSDKFDQRVSSSRCRYLVDGPFLSALPPPRPPPHPPSRSSEGGRPRPRLEDGEFLGLIFLREEVKIQPFLPLSRDLSGMEGRENLSVSPPPRSLYPPRHPPPYPPHPRSPPTWG